MTTKKLAFLGYGVLLLALILAPFFGAYPVFVMKLMCFALFASAFNLLLGYTGLLSFGHAAFLGGAAYMAGHTIKVWGVTPEIGIILGTLGGAAIGLVAGWLAIRRQGIYFSMITLALAQMLFFVCLQMPFTGGEDGLQGVPRGKLFGLIDLSNDLTMYYVALVIVVLGFLLIVRTVHSPFGQVLKAIKENEPRAISLGYDVNRFKLLVFVLSAGLTGLAGALKTVVLGFATLSDVHWTTSGHVILMTLIGGLGTLMTGWHPGAIGETCGILILIVGAILAWRQVIDWRVPLVYLLTIAVLAAASALIGGVASYQGVPGFLWYPLVHVFSGGVIFGAVFMLTDPVTSPTSAQGRVIFAMGAAILTMLIRLKANLPEGCLYSILLMNMLTPLIESAMDGKQLAVRARARKAIAGLAAIGLAVTVLAASTVTPVNEISSATSESTSEASSEATGGDAS